ncbi:MAG: hypothetical protein AAF511_05935 [Pseudomonadota bacterium]
MIRAFFATMVLCFGSANAAVIDFSQFNAGDLVTTLVADGVGITVNSRAYRPGADPTDRAMVFDSENYTGGDDDLGGPFTDVRGGADLTPGNILILSEDGDASDPDDNARGGWIEFVFDTPVDFQRFAAFDINHVGAIDLELFGASGSLGSVSNQFAAVENGFELIEFAMSDVTRAIFSLSGSGAIGNIALTNSAVQTPLPAAGLLFGVAFLAGYQRCRRKPLKGNGKL